MEKNSYTSPSTDKIDDHTQPRPRNQDVSTEYTQNTQSYREWAAGSAAIYAEQTRKLEHGWSYQPQPLPVQTPPSTDKQAVWQAQKPAVQGGQGQRTRKVNRMAKEQALRITRGLKKGVVVASVLSLGTFAVLAEIHTLNTPVVQAAPRQHASPTTTGPSKSTGPVLGPPDKTSATPTQATPTPSNAGGSSSTGQAGSNGDQNGNGGFNFGSGNSQGPATGSNVS